MKKDLPRKEMQKKHEKKAYIPSKKVQEDRKESNQKEIDKYQTLFSLENKISKIKILVPFNEILRNSKYIKQIITKFKSENVSLDILNLQDDHPTLLFGPRVEENDHDDDGDVPPFFINLNIHEMILHNSILDSGASHNLMPKAIMDNLGLDIT